MRVRLVHGDAHRAQAELTPSPGTSRAHTPPGTTGGLISVYWTTRYQPAAVIRAQPPDASVFKIPPHLSKGCACLLLQAALSHKSSHGIGVAAKRAKIASNSGSVASSSPGFSQSACICQIPSGLLGGMLSNHPPLPAYCVCSERGPGSVKPCASSGLDGSVLRMGAVSAPWR